MICDMAAQHGLMGRGSNFCNGELRPRLQKCSNIKGIIIITARLAIFFLKAGPSTSFRSCQIEILHLEIEKAVSQP